MAIDEKIRVGKLKYDINRESYDSENDSDSKNKCKLLLKENKYMISFLLRGMHSIL